ncbi:hypothetical protein HDU88_005321 [Geranomyces variabilis]|nr:hypothetical protein HDU88_005321 [Geranomyces variabilis]
MRQPFRPGVVRRTARNQPMRKKKEYKKTEMTTNSNTACGVPSRFYLPKTTTSPGEIWEHLELMQRVREQNVKYLVDTGVGLRCEETVPPYLHCSVRHPEGNVEHREELEYLGE